MSMSTALTRLYPPAIRQRWGRDIAREVELSGPRAWPDTVIGAAKLWLHPGDWPETSTGQTGRVVTTALFAVVTALVLVLRAAGSTPLTSSADRLGTSTWLVPVVIGLALSIPLPSLHGAAFGRLAAAATRNLAMPVLPLVALYVLAHSGLADHAVGPQHILLVVYYWATLCFVGIGLCLLVARVGRVAVMPSKRRLSVALSLAGTGLSLAAAETFATAVRTAVDIELLTLCCGLAGLAAAVLTAALDLRRIARQR